MGERLLDEDLVERAQGGDRAAFDDKVGETLDGLPPDLRQAVMMREFDGLAYEEIAEAMNCPIGTVRSRIFRARAAIDQALDTLLK